MEKWKALAVARARLSQVRPGQVVASEALSALRLACERISDSGQTHDEAADTNTWMRRFLGKALGRCLSATSAPCGTCVWCTERRWIASSRRRRKTTVRVRRTVDQQLSDIVIEVLAELSRAQAKFPKWPTDPVHAAAIVAEECGEVQKAVLEAVYEPHKCGRPHVRLEAKQAAAMCLRFMLSLENYEWYHAKQHLQRKPQVKVRKVKG